jgi:tripartite-type tricarboxylate transporter receptor subunit TctC
MAMRRRLPVLALLVAMLSPGAMAQDDAWPTQTVRLIAPSGPGGNPDVLARLLAEKLGSKFGRPFIVENMPGAGGILAANVVAKTSPDGHVLMFGDSGNMAINPALNPNLGYDPIKDFAPVTALVSLPTIMSSNPNVPANTLDEFIALAKKQPGKMSYGSAGAGSIHHLTMAIFAGRTGIELRGYCVSVLQRSPSTPAIPTCDELGQNGFDVATVMGLQAPSGTPPKVIARLQAELAAAMREPAMVTRMHQLGMVMEENGTANYVAFMKRDMERYAQAVKKLGLQEAK